MNIKLIRRAATIAVCGMAMLNVHAAAAQGAIDNSALSSLAFREHKRTFGLVGGVHVAGGGQRPSRADDRRVMGAG